MRVLRCALPNASDLISGVPFAPAPDGRGMVSAPVDAATAERFARIPGYSVEAAPDPDPAIDETPVAVDKPPRRPRTPT